MIHMMDDTLFNSKQKVIVWLSFARSGTNWVSDLLGHLSNIDSFREIFQNKGVHVYCSSSSNEYKKYLIKGLSKQFGLNTTNVRDEKLVNHVRNNPQETINTLLSLSKKNISFKIFHNHLSWDLVKDILMRNDVICFVLIRNPLETFISAKKVKIANRAIEVDTTNIKTELSCEEYYSFLSIRSNWINFINKHYNLINGFMHYENLFTFFNDDYSRISCLSNMLKTHLVDPGSITQSSIKVTNIQDRSPDIKEKFANSKLFFQECTDRGIPVDRDLSILEVNRLSLR